MHSTTLRGSFSPIRTQNGSIEVIQTLQTADQTSGGSSNAGSDNVLSTNLSVLESGTHQAIWYWDGAANSGNGSYGTITNGTSQIKLQQADGNEVVGTISTSNLDETILLFNIDSDTIPANTLTSVNKIVNPLTFNPGTVANGTRYLIIDELGDSTTAWGDVEASVNDIVQYNSSTGKWSVVFDASDPDSTQHYVTNLNTGIQYKWNGVEWLKSYEGVYIAGKWTLVLDGGSSQYDPSTDVNNP